MQLSESATLSLGTSFTRKTQLPPFKWCDVREAYSSTGSFTMPNMNDDTFGWNEQEDEALDCQGLTSRAASFRCAAAQISRVLGAKTLDQ